jgi:nucleotide-binding universal stress UspA family protein
MERRRWFVVGTDFSPAADHALDLAAELASDLGASVAVVHAFEDRPDAGAESDPTPHLRAHLEESVSVVRARHPSLRVDCVVRRGAAWAKLVNVAYELGAEMIVIGAGGDDSAKQPRFLGHVVTRVAATSNRSVLVVPAPAAGSVPRAD